MFEDSAELQVFFVTQRDFLCKDGQTFMSPALNYTKRKVLSQIEEEKKGKQNNEEIEDEKTSCDEIKRQSNIDDILVIVSLILFSIMFYPMNMQSRCSAWLDG